MKKKTSKNKEGKGEYAYENWYYWATGRVGTRVLKEARNRQHIVTAIVRDITKLTDQQTSVVKKDIFALTADDLAPFDVIVNAFGAPFGQEYLHMKVAEHLIALLQGKDSPRMVVDELESPQHIRERFTVGY